MWHWDQGRLEYFQFDNLRKIAQFVMKNDFKNSTRNFLQTETGLPFAAPPTYSPWRNYSRVLRLMLLVRVHNGQAVPTAVAEMLATPGSVTCDEYLHFIVSIFTEPSPALKSWNPDVPSRYPLLFALKYLLAKKATRVSSCASFDEIVGAYAVSQFIGDEEQSAFISLLNVPCAEYENTGSRSPDELKRQARESLLVLAQISYLHVDKTRFIVSLDQEDACKIFNDLGAFKGNPEQDRELEINRLAEMFRGGSSYEDFDYANTIINETIESGFSEGGKIKRTHIIIERNAGIRSDFFALRPLPVCDVCGMDTKITYPWVDRIIDLHHLLPLASGTRVDIKGTTFDDLVPVCPTCHRATHRFYEQWLYNKNRNDFMDRNEAKDVYLRMKTDFKGIVCAASV